jgi:hypothetical protein
MVNVQCFVGKFLNAGSREDREGVRAKTAEPGSMEEVDVNFAAFAIFLCACPPKPDLSGA